MYNFISDKSDFSSQIKNTKNVQLRKTKATNTTNDELFNLRHTQV